MADHENLLPDSKTKVEDKTCQKLAFGVGLIGAAFCLVGSGAILPMLLAHLTSSQFPDCETIGAKVNCTLPSTTIIANDALTLANDTWMPISLGVPGALALLCAVGLIYNLCRYGCNELCDKTNKQDDGDKPTSPPSYGTRSA